MNRLVGPLLILACTVIWGTAFLAQKSGCDHFGPFAITCFRNVIAGLFLSAMVFLRDKFAPERRVRQPSDVRTCWIGGALGGIALFLAMLTQQLGIERTTPGISAFLTANYILFVPFFAWLLGRGRPHLGVWLGVVFALIGTYLICLGSGAADSSAPGGFGAGELWTLLCALLFASQIMIVDRFAPSCDVLRFSAVQVFAAGLCAAPFVLLPSEMMRLSWTGFQAGLFSLFYLGVMSSGIAYTLQNLGQARTPPALAAVIMSFESVVGALGGWLVRGDALTGWQILGCAFVFFAILLAQGTSLGGNEIRELIKSALIGIWAVVHRDDAPKTVFYHDVGRENTPMGTDASLFWAHMDLIRPDDLVCFDDGFRGIWSARETFKRRGIRPKVFLAVRLVGERGYLNWEEIRTLRTDYGFDFQCHTWSHQTLVGPQIDESPKAERTEAWYAHELIDAKAELTRQLGAEVTELCFPVGYFNDALVARCRAVGYARVYASYPGNRSSDYLQPRNIAQDASPRTFRHILNGGLMALKNRYYALHLISRNERTLMCVHLTPP